MLNHIEHPYKSLHKYPGMRPKDVAIWDQLILNQPGIFNRVWYDVHLGDPVKDIKEHERMRATGMFDVSQWCVDVIADDGVNYYVIEIKPNAAAGALGQALAYTALLKKEHNFDRPVLPVVLTEDIAPITKQAAELLGVAIFTP